MSKILKILFATAATLTLAGPATAQSASDTQRFRDAQSRFDRAVSDYRAEVDRYVSLRGGRYYNNNNSNDGYNRPYYDQNGNSVDDRYENGYDPAHDYRSGNYQERVLSSNDRVYRGTDGQYYCKRADGTTGLIVGAIGGGVLGNVIDGGHSRGVGTILGAIGGAVAGRAIDRSQTPQEIRCR